MPKISVIVPIYKVEKYLKKCVDSILSQSFTDFELILVDDGSPDNCPQMCDDFAKQDKRIRVIHKENGGLSDARNAGIDWAFENSDSEWFAFVDSDDWLHTDYLKKLYDACTQNDADICMCDFERVDENGKTVEKPHSFPDGVYSDKEDFFGILCSEWRTVVAWNKLYRRSVFDNIRYDFGKIHEDEFIIHKLLAESNRICYLPEPLYYYVMRGGSIMSFEKEIDIKLVFLEIGIIRYWFCKKRKLPIDKRVTDASYLDHVMSLEKAVGDEEKDRYRKLKKAYRDVFIDASESHMKRRLMFDFYTQYKKAKGID